METGLREVNLKWRQGGGSADTTEVETGLAKKWRQEQVSGDK